MPASLTALLHLIPRTVVTALAVTSVAFAGNDGIDAKGANAPAKHPRFDKIDADHDGFISLKEWEAAKAARRAKHPEKQQSDGAKKHEGHPVFDKMDTDKDSKVSLVEWIAFRDARKKAREALQPAAAPTAPASAAAK